jgi:AraC-like DNA-binding protein
MLNKSQKTLSYSKKIQRKSLLQIIQIKYLKLEDYYYSDKSIKEIAYEIGYEDIQSFSRFLRKCFL